MMMRIRTDPLPDMPMLPQLQAALLAVRLELSLVALEHPDLTAHQQLREARRRCAQRCMLVAADAIETSQRRKLLHIAGRESTKEKAPGPEFLPTQDQALW